MKQMRQLRITLLMLCVLGLAYAPAFAGCTTPVTMTTTSTSLLASGDLGAGIPRSYLSITNSGPDVAFCALGTSNAATTANGILLLIGETLQWQSMQNVNGRFIYPPNGDVACITFNGGGNTTANVVGCDY
jgi:hypothetical protein